MKEKGIFWCKECNIPLLTKFCENCGSQGKYFTIDLKPVFEKERIMLEDFLSIELPDILFRWQNRIMFEGETLFRFKTDFKNLKLYPDKPIEIIKNKIKEYSKESWKECLKRIDKCNKKILTKKERKSIKFIKEISKQHSEKFKIISFGGGKDSVIVSYLVKKALGNTPLFFGDTTLEYPETYEFIEEFANKYNFKLIRDNNGEFYKSDQNFFELCNKFGPPSIRYRWCCYVFKAYSVSKFYETLNDRALAFSGTRRAESLSRKDYPAIKESGGKIARQVLIHPIIDWIEADVWFLLFRHKLLNNPLYEMGHMRVGCWPCPNAGPSMCFYRKFTHKYLWDKMEKVLREYAKKMGESEEWITNGWWRLRTPGRNKKIIEPLKIINEKNNYKFRYKIPFDIQAMEHLKTLGNLKITKNNGYYKYNISSNSFSINGTIRKRISDIVLNCKKQNYLDFKKIFEKLIARAINCIGCGGCVATCPNGAMKIIDNHLIINSDKCNFCGKCVKSNCMALKFAQDRVQIKANLFKLEPCIEGMPMNHMVIPDPIIGKEFAEIIKAKGIDFEIHEDGKIVCISNKLNESEIDKIFNKFINQQTKNQQTKILIK